MRSVLSSLRPRLRCASTAVVCALWIGSSATAQQGPVLPTFRQDFPNPSNAGAPSSGIPSGPEAPRRREETYIPGSDVMPEVFKPPAIPSDPDPPTISSPPSLTVPALPKMQRETRSVNSRAMTSYNFGFAATEALLNELAADVRQDASAVSDRILGAAITGSQTTTATTRIDCRRNAQTAQFDVVLQSLTNSNTIGRRPNAMVATEGCHRADLLKPVFFDGTKLTTRQPQGFIRANNLNRDVRTPFSTMPLFGPMATQIARTQTERLRSTAETEAADRLARRVVPQFNQSVDQQLSVANQALAGELRNWLQSRQLYPDEMKTTTTDDELRLRAKFGNPTTVGIPGRRLSGRLGSVLVHQSAVNKYIAGLNLGGRVISDQRLQQMVAGGGADLGIAAEAKLFSLVLADTDPIRVRFAGGSAEVLVRMSIQPVGGGATPMQRVRIPMRLDTESSLQNMTLRFGTPSVSPDDGSEPTAIQTALAQQIADRLRTIELPRDRTVRISDRKSVTFKLGKIEAVNGWLLMSLD